MSESEKKELESDEKETSDEEKENSENEDDTEDELLKLKKKFAKEYFSSLKKSDSSLPNMLLAEAGTVEDYLTNEGIVDSVKDKVILGTLLKKFLSEDVFAALDTIKDEIEQIDSEDKKEVEKKLDELRIKYNLKSKPKETVAPANDTPNDSVTPAVASPEVKKKAYVAPFETDGKIQLSSPFGPRIFDGQNHTGIDIGKEEGTPILSMSDGEVVQVRKTKLGGNEIHIKDASGKVFYYLHMKEKSPLTVGQIVKAGEKVGEVGNTGRSTGNHLHLTVTENDKPVDPVKLFPEFFEQKASA